ncbi:MAG: hypothetical protein NTW30_02260 [Candidatus Aenigmarchaeota archaeon]|nr:hypothetical protein [Candidatus Aenigmarchaeota archaeon]
MGFLNFFRRLLQKKEDFFNSPSSDYIPTKNERRMINRVLDVNYNRFKTRILPKISQFENISIKQIEKYQSEFLKSNLEKIKALDRPLEQTIWRIKLAEELKTKGELAAELDSIVKDLSNLFDQYEKIHFIQLDGKHIDNIPFDVRFDMENEFSKIHDSIFLILDSLERFLKIVKEGWYLGQLL